VKAQLAASRDKFAMPPDAIARAIALAIEQPADIDVNEIVIRPTAQDDSGGAYMQPGRRSFEVRSALCLET